MEGFWQDFTTRPSAGPPYQDRYSVTVGTSVLDLPIRPLPQGGMAVASFIANQASFTVIDRLTAAMAALACDFHPDIVVGLPTLGLTFAPGIARALGHQNYVPLGYSRKF